MMMVAGGRWTCLCLAVSLVCWLRTDAVAQDVPPVEYYTNSPLLVGSDTPRLEVTTYEDLEDVEVELRRGRHRQNISLGAVSRGNAAEITFESPLGVHEWRAELSGIWNGDRFSLTFEFDFEVTEGLEVEIPLDRVDLEQQELAVVLNRPADRVEYVITRDDGTNMGGGTVSFSGESPGTTLRVPWQQGSGTVLRILLTIYDTAGFWSEVELIPWSVNIPHEEINFATGSDVIEPDEQPKIDVAYTQLNEAVQRYGDFVEIQLYIAGYTDTVGSNSDNNQLSDQRARAIARAFRDRGFRYPIFYQGFGEDGLAVPTPDNTDEARNRRALYVLAAQPPLPSGQIPRANWRPID